jgi:hypothetical protein
MKSKTYAAGDGKGGDMGGIESNDSAVIGGGGKAEKPSPYERFTMFGSDSNFGGSRSNSPRSNSPRTYGESF